MKAGDKVRYKRPDDGSWSGGEYAVTSNDGILVRDSKRGDWLTVTYFERLGPLAPPINCTERVCDQLRQRREVGLTKYGTDVDGNPLDLRQWLQHLQEELLDAAVYVERLKAALHEVVQTMSKEAANVPQAGRMSGETVKAMQSPMNTLLASFAWPQREAITNWVEAVKRYRNEESMDIRLEGLDEFDADDSDYYEFYIERAEASA